MPNKNTVSELIRLLAYRDAIIRENQTFEFYLEAQEMIRDTAILARERIFRFAYQSLSIL